MNENENIRIEFFSDAVFAIAITLLILEIKVSPMPENSMDLSRSLHDLYPSYFAYVFSFLMIGIYWTNHYRIFKLFRRGDDGLVLLNIFFLMCIAFLPFPTAVLAEYLTNSDQRQTAITFYTIGLFLPSFAWLLMWLYAGSGHRLVDEKLSDGFIKRQTAKFALTNGLYILAILLSLRSGAAALALCVGLTLLYLIPPKRAEYLESAGGDS